MKKKTLIWGCLLVGLLCLSYGAYTKYWYSDLLEKAVEDIRINRLDGQELEKAEKSVFASRDLILYNKGVKAYRAGNLKEAVKHFFDIIRTSKDPVFKARVYYNLGNVLTQQELPKRAADMYRAALRIDPTDWESKYNLERLYVFYPMAFPDETEQASSLDPEPGDEKLNSQMGRSGPSAPDI